MTSRSLRFGDLALYGVAMTLGIRWVASAAAAGPASLPLWVAAMLGFMGPLVIVTAEMTGRIAGDGGIYHWTRDTLGPLPGFLCGWLYWTCNLPFFSGLVVFIFGVVQVAVGHRLGVWLNQPGVFFAGAAGVTLLVGALHWAGLSAGKWMSSFGAIANLTLLALLVTAGAVLGLEHRGATPLAGATYAPPINADGAALWSAMVFAFGGAEGLALLRGEVRGGTATILRVLAVVGAVLALAYMAGTLAMLAILPPQEISRLSGLPEALSLGMARFGLGGFAFAPLLLLALALLGGFNAWFGVAARLPFVVGADRYLPAFFSRRDPRTGAPVAAIAVQVVAVIALVGLSEAGSTVKGAYDFLVSMSVLSYTLPFVLLFLAYLRIQKTPPPAGAWRPWGGPIAARLIGLGGLLVTLSAIACTLVPSPDATDKVGAVVKLVLASGVLIATGLAAYLWGRPRAPAANPA